MSSSALIKRTTVSTSSDDIDGEPVVKKRNFTQQLLDTCPEGSKSKVAVQIDEIIRNFTVALSQPGQPVGHVSPRTCAVNDEFIEICIRFEPDVVLEFSTLQKLQQANVLRFHSMETTYTPKQDMKVRVKLYRDENIETTGDTPQTIIQCPINTKKVADFCMQKLGVRDPVPKAGKSMNRVERLVKLATNAVYNMYPGAKPVFATEARVLADGELVLRYKGLVQYKWETLNKVYMLDKTLVENLYVFQNKMMLVFKNAIVPLVTPTSSLIH